VPGPSLEGYLFPDTYRFAAGVPLDTVVSQMVRRYQLAWTVERRARLDTLGLTENEITTLASIIQAEARQVEEMPRIASVYHGRLERGMLLQADPTVLFALGGYRARLLFAAIDSVAESPYNTYTQPGLPPGPIGAPGDAAIEAALYPANEPYLYFVARPDGTHIFTRSLAEHNRAVGVARAERDAPGRQK
jgi:peptidoglycan lytic transglycosylase G